MKRYKGLPERELAILLNSKDMKAYEEVYHRYFRLTFEAARKLTFDDSLSKDIVQDAFLRMHNQLGVTDFTRVKIGGYLYTAVRNIFFNLLDRKKLHINYLASLADFANTGEFTTDQQVRDWELSRLLEEEVAQLPPKMRRVFELKRKEYLTHKEIAELTNQSEEAVKKLYIRAIQRLRSKFSRFLLLYTMSAILVLGKFLK